LWKSPPKSLRRAARQAASALGALALKSATISRIFSSRSRWTPIMAPIASWFSRWGQHRHVHAVNEKDLPVYRVGKVEQRWAV
jgi:hypothetical protein